MLVRLLTQLFKPTPDSRRLETRAAELYAAGRLGEAEAGFREVIRQQPDSITNWTNLAVTLARQGRSKAARQVFEHVLELEPRHVGAHIELANILWRGGEVRAALDHYRSALAIEPENPVAFANLFKPLMDACDWTGLDQHFASWMHLVDSAPEPVWAERMTPLVSLMLPMPAQVRKAVAIYHSGKVSRTTQRQAGLPARRGLHADGRIRIGYVSADFGNHPVAHLTAGVYGLHDRTRFKVFGYSLAADDGSEYRKRIAQGCDRFVELTGETPYASAQRIAADGIDILVDLMGHTRGARPQIFALRPAPIQVLSGMYPGTTGADFIDYCLADRTVVPPGCEQEFTEQLALLPHAYLATDHLQRIADEPVTRAEFGLSERAFVFCCFNQNYKLDPAMFGVWVRILRALPDSEIWLFASNSDASASLTRMFVDQGVALRRIVFAEKLEKPQHLARLRLADLFLDTYYYNAHTTAVDALWAGLPVLTCPGGSFPARVAASLLRAIDLPELIAGSLAQYEQIAIELARNPGRLAGIRQRLAENRLICPLFDTPKYVRNLEHAYRTMWDIHSSGDPPRPFEIID